MYEFEVGGKTFQADKLDAFEQFHVARRLGSLFPNIISALETHDKNVVMSMSYIAMGLSRLAQDDADYILHTCLKKCKIKQANNIIAPIVSPTGALMFNDMELKDLMEMTWKVLEHNLGNFIQGLLDQMKTVTEAPGTTPPKV